MNEMKINLAVEEKFSVKKAAGFGFNYFSSILNMLFISYLTFFATDSLYMSAGMIGMVLLLSKFMDGITDVIAGILIDRTHSKWGKARPYVLMGVLAWVATVLMFCVPNLSDFGKAVYIFIFYNLNQSIFYTLSNVAKTVHLKRSIAKEENRIKTLTISGMVYSIGSLALNIAFPMLVAMISGRQAGWITMAAGLAVISSIGILLCFFWCPEYQDIDDGAVKKEETIPLGKALLALLKNKYIFMYALMQFVTSVISTLSMGAGTYYFTYIVGDLMMFSLVSAVSIVAFPLLPFIPKMVGKIGKRGLLFAGFAMGAFGAVIRLIGYANIPLLCIGNLINSFGLVPTNFVGPEVVIDCMKYTEKKSGLKLEAIFSSVENVALKLAAGIGSGALGFILAYVGYNGAAAEQTATAVRGINFLYNWIPIILYAVLAIITILFFDVEKKLKEIE